jgi:membrane protease YdiL (CAAX protease family)
MPPEEMPGAPEYIPELEPSEPAALPPPTPEPRRREAFWGYQDLAIVLGLMFGAVVVIGVGAMASVSVWHLSVMSPPVLLFSNLAVYLALLLTLKFVFNSRYGQPVLPSLGWMMRSTTVLMWAAIGGMALPFIISGIGWLLRTPQISTPMDQIPDSIPLAIMAVLLAPFFEELFFRGFLQPLLVKTFGLVLGVLITAGLFGALHTAEYSFVWQYVVAVSLVGVALGFVRVWTDSIVPTTVMHSCFNGLQVVVAALSKHHQ